MNPKINLKKILDLHAFWISGDPEGERANLTGADLTGANLYGANLNVANLTRADLTGANLTRADLYGANLTRADLTGADLTGANLTGANLYGANLYGANLTGADLTGANLTGANLYGANLKDCKEADLAIAMTTHLPEGPFWGWKKCKDGIIVKLLIPANARRSQGCKRKCRAEFVKVLQVIGGKFGVSQYDGKTEYRKGQMVYPDAWDEDRWNTCGQGIHFFLTRIEAENY